MFFFALELKIEVECVEMDNMFCSKKMVLLLLFVKFLFFSFENFMLFDVVHDVVVINELFENIDEFFCFLIIFVAKSTQAILLNRRLYTSFLQHFSAFDLRPKHCCIQKYLKFE